MSSTVKIFRLIALLKGKVRYTAQQLAKYVEVSECISYQDMVNLELIGFYIEKDSNNRYFLICENFMLKNIRSFSPEDNRLLRDVIIRDQ